MDADSRGTAELVDAALGRSGDDEERWAIVIALHRRATREVFDAAVALCRREAPGARLLGADVLGQLGVETRPFREEALPVLVSLLDDPDAAVAGAAGVALGHHRDPARVPQLDVTAVNALVAHAGHASAEVRLGVVNGLSSLDDDRAVAVLIALSGDPDDAVRDWATFGLGSLIDRDTPDVREALWARVSDSDAEARGEALVGLARRRDGRVEALVRAALAEGAGDRLVDEAAELLRTPR